MIIKARFFRLLSFKVIDNRLLKKYIKIWEKISILVDKKFDSEPVYGDNNKYIGTKRKTYRDKMHAHFQGKIIPKKNTPCKWLLLIMLDYVIKVYKKYYPQTLLDECKYEIKKTKMENLINDNLEKGSSDDETDNDSDNETDNETDNEADNESSD